jgi:uncharacterized protein YjhX (UPF0386 family)
MNNFKNLTTRIIDFEDGLLDEDTTIELFQDLLSSGLINNLQGSYQRTARTLLEKGLIT